MNDIPKIMLIEQESFHDNVIESKDVFQERIGVFSEGFLILETEDNIAGYICSELWEHSENIDTEKLSLNHKISDTHKNTGSDLYIASIGVLGRYRGKGYGSILLNELEERVKITHDVSAILLAVSVKWEAARGIYEKNGFEEVQRIKGFFEDEDISDAIVMKKIL